MHNQNLPFAIIAKPFGPICNLDCRYCFYLEKKRLFRDTSRFQMTPEILETFIRQYIESQDVPAVHFSWQGGEPTLLGVDFFQRVVALQDRYANGKKVTNAIQTNGIVLDDGWCEFLANNDFLVGLSVDGPRELHDRYRVDKRQRPTFDAVMRGVGFLKKHGTSFNTLTVVNDVNSQSPLEVYLFLREIGDGFMQFIPLVERKPDHNAKGLGLSLGLPPTPDDKDQTSTATPWSVRPKQLGEFYVRIFDEWVRKDVGKVFVQFFDVALGNWMGAGSGLCQFAPRCGHAAALEHNGDLYACDHYVYPKHKIGNTLESSLSELMASARQQKFGNDKRDLLPQYCRECEILFACNGDCPKHRFIKTPDGESGLSYLCTAYRRVFKHMGPYMGAMANLVRSGREAAQILEYVAEEDRLKQFSTAKRNDPCPCGSGRKYKKCCGTPV
ncbi:MAG: anaerobic sulfatase-maturation protein [Desulfobacteraceae bacterium]|nr:anaerobic sulfatase-maturation protein [Desulfobacteraceae bacterium]